MSQSFDPSVSPGSSTNPQAPADVNEQKQIGRRALIAAAGLGLVGIGAAEAPNILNGVGALTQQEIQQAINFGRQQLARELLTVEDVSIDTAITVTNLLHSAVNTFVVPIANVLATVTEDILGGLSAAIEQAETWPGLNNISALKQVDTILKQWKANVALFPNIINALNNVDTTAADTYLSKLKTKLQSEAGKS